MCLFGLDLPNSIDVEYHDTVASTNTLLKQYANSGVREGKIVAAREQCCGRGRLGREFFSPGNTGLYMSILLRPAMTATDEELLTCAAAVACVNTVFAVTGKKVGIKWVNDIMLDGKKICGILCEKSTDILGKDYVVIGIGMNVFYPQNGFPNEISDTAGSLFAPEALPDGEIVRRMMREIILRFFDIYKTFDKKDLMREYVSHSCIIGREVTFTRGKEVLSGRVKGIDSNGCLLLMQNAKIYTFSSGEITKIRMI